MLIQAVCPSIISLSLIISLSSLSFIIYENITSNTKVTTKGSGFVSEQSITEGQKISKKDKIEVTLSSEEINGETADDESKSKDNEENKEDKE